MDTEKRLKYVGVIMNAWLYGVEDTANLFFDKPNFSIVNGVQLQLSLL